MPSAAGETKSLAPAKTVIRTAYWSFSACATRWSEARFPAQLSGGQRQRVALARALAIEPRVLLLDEPFGALDAKVRKDLRRWLRELHDRTGHTTLFVTHDQEEAFELADRVAILNKGKIEQIGTPAQIVNHPATDFVADFVDGINFSRLNSLRDPLNVVHFPTTKHLPNAS